MLAEYPEEPFRICDDASEQQRIDVLQDIAVKASSKPYIQQLAHTVRNEAGRGASTKRLTQEALLAIQCLEYHQHPEGEWFQGVSYTLQHGGNCEDLSTALVALLLALNIPARVAWIDQYDMPLNHVAVRLENGLWADPSVWGARLGEDSYSAIDRVQIEGVTRPADLAFRASKEYPMFKRNLKMKPARRSAGDPLGLMDPGRLPSLTPTGTSVPSGPVLAILVPIANRLFTVSPPTISGTAPPGFQVKVVRADTGASIGMATAAADGSWSLPLPVFGPGPYALTASTPDGANTTVPFAIAAPVSITAPVDGATLSASPTQAMGIAAPGTLISIVHNADVVGTATADSLGSWQIALPAYGPGVHSISATGNGYTAKVTFTLTGSVVAPSSPSATPAVAAGSSNAMWWLLGGAAIVGLLLWSSSKKEEEEHARHQ